MNRPIELTAPVQLDRAIALEPDTLTGALQWLDELLTRWIPEDEAKLNQPHTANRMKMMQLEVETSLVRNQFEAEKNKAENMAAQMRQAKAKILGWNFQIDEALRQKEEARIQKEALANTQAAQFEKQLNALEADFLAAQAPVVKTEQELKALAATKDALKARLVRKLKLAGIPEDAAWNF